MNKYRGIDKIIPVDKGIGDCFCKRGFRNLQLSGCIEIVIFLNPMKISLYKINALGELINKPPPDFLFIPEMFDRYIRTVKISGFD